MPENGIFEGKSSKGLQGHLHAAGNQEQDETVHPFSKGVASISQREYLQGNKTEPVPSLRWQPPAHFICPCACICSMCMYEVHIFLFFSLKWLIALLIVTITIAPE